MIKKNYILIFKITFDKELYDVACYKAHKLIFNKKKDYLEIN